MNKYTELLFNTKTRKELADIAASCYAREDFYRIHIASSKVFAERIIEITRKIDNLPVSPLVREELRDLRYYARLLGTLND